MKKHIKIAYVIVFVLLFIAPTIIYEIFGGYLDQTNYEQRQAVEKPAFSLDTIEQYPQAFEAYYNDSLPFRNQMITTNSLLNLRLFKLSAVEKVIIGKDDWLFYNPSGNDGDPIADYHGTNLLTQEHLAMFAANLVAVRDTLELQGKEFVVLIAPNKECMYGNTYLPAGFKTENTYTRSDQVVEYLSEHTDLTVVYPKEQILGAMQTDPDHIYYYKTDTHWNELGSYIGTRELLKSVGISIPGLEEQKVSKKNETAGDLAGMLGLSKYLQYDDVYHLDNYCKNQKVEQVYPIENNTNLICSTTTNADTRSLFMVRDSFATAMIPYLNTQFDHCTFVHNNIYSPDMLEQYPSDIVVLEVVERYIWNLANFKVE